MDFLIKELMLFIIIVNHYSKKNQGQQRILPFLRMLRHSTEFYLANKGHDIRAIQSCLGHANIKNTAIYTAFSPQRLQDC